MVHGVQSCEHDLTVGKGLLRNDCGIIPDGLVFRSPSWLADLPLATGDGVPDGIVGGLVGYKVMPERGVAQNARQAGGMTWLAEPKVANTI